MQAGVAAQRLGERRACLITEFVAAKMKRLQPGVDAQPLIK